MCLLRIPVESLTLRPRVILVTEEGQLLGLVTVKDLLRHEVHQQTRSQSAANSRPRTPLGAQPSNHNRNESTVSSNGWNESWADVELDHRGHGLEIALEEGLAWVRARAAPFTGLLARFSGRRTGGGHEEAMSYELGEGS